MAEEDPTEQTEITGSAPRRRTPWSAVIGMPRLRDTARPEPTAKENVAVLGLGRFGGQVAATLLQLGHEVLGIDSDAHVVQQWADQLTQVAQADTTDEETLRQLAVPEFSRVVVGIGTRVEASVLTVVTLVEVGVEEIWAKATSAKHGKILSAVGARHVVYPEAAMGSRVAHLITSKMLDFIELDDDYAIAKTYPPASTIGRSLSDSAIRSTYGVTVVGVKRPGAAFEYGLPETLVPPDGVLIIAGTVKQVQRFAATT